MGDVGKRLVKCERCKHLDSERCHSYGEVDDFWGRLPITFPYSGRPDTRREPRHCSIEPPGCPPQPTPRFKYVTAIADRECHMGILFHPVARLYPVHGFQR
jgi:hypothetical protein